TQRAGDRGTQGFAVLDVLPAKAGRNRARGKAPRGEKLQAQGLAGGARGDDAGRHDLARQARPGPGLLAVFHGGYRVVSMNVTLLISFSVVIPALIFCSADSRRKRIPSSWAALRISDDGRFSRINSRIRSERSSNSWIAVRP